MKYQIRKFNFGGAVFTPIVNTMPTGPSREDSGKSKSNTKDSDSSVLDDEVLDLLYKSKGLTNDVNKFVKEIIALEQDDFGMPYSDSAKRTKLLHMIGRINEISESKEYWKDAIQRAKESGGLGEIAVDNNGRIFMKDKNNKIISVDPGNIQKGRGNPLSVQELMYERQNNPELAGVNSIFTVADNSIGIKQIGDHISKMIAALGREESVTESIFSKAEVAKHLQSMGGAKPTDSDMESLSILNEVLRSPSEYSKVKIEKSTERNHINTALRYIWNSLGGPAQQKLMALSKLQGEKDPTNFLMSMLVRGTDNSSKISIGPISDKTATGKGSDDSNDPKKVAWTPAELAWMDKLYRPGITYNINNPNAGVAMDMTATFKGPLYELSKDGEVIAPTVVTNILGKSKYQSIVDPNEAYLGDVRIDRALLSEMVYSGNDVAKVFAPVRQDGSLDLASMERFNQVFKVYQDNKDQWTIPQAEAYFANNDFPGVKIKRVAGRDGKVSSELVENNAVRPFLAIPILANSLSELSDNPWMTKLVGEERDKAKQVMDNAFIEYGGTPSKPKKIDGQQRSWFSSERPYSGTVFIAFRPEAPAYLSSMSRHFFGEGVDEETVRRNLQHSTNDNYSKTDGSSRHLW